MQKANVHASALVIGSQGVLIFGPSGSGKTSLVFQLVDSALAKGQFASFVSDDRVWLQANNGKLIAEAPEAIKGLAEVYFYGPAAVLHQNKAVIDRVVTLVDSASAPRYHEDMQEIIEGIVLPGICLPMRDAHASSRAVHAWLSATFVG